eukprot:1016973-Prorocentrum_minimum.AAC.1
MELLKHILFYCWRRSDVVSSGGSAAAGEWLVGAMRASWEGEAAANPVAALDPVRRQVAARCLHASMAEQRRVDGEAPPFGEDSAAALARAKVRFAVLGFDPIDTTLPIPSCTPPENVGNARVSDVCAPRELYNTP